MVARFPPTPGRVPARSPGGGRLGEAPRGIRSKTTTTKEEDTVPTTTIAGHEVEVNEDFLTKPDQWRTSPPSWPSSSACWSSRRRALEADPLPADD